MKRVLLLLLVACSPTIPYFEQVGPSCVQSQMRIALEYFFPERDYSQDYLDELTGRSSNSWTWFSQAFPVLLNEGLDVYYFSSTPYFMLSPEFVVGYYGKVDGVKINSVTDWVPLYSSIDFLKSSDRFVNEKLSWSDVESFFNQGYLLLMIIDANVVDGKLGRSFAGHGVTITDIDDTSVTYHDSVLGPNKKVGKQSFIDAWNAKGTDNDVLVVRGRI